MKMSSLTKAAGLAVGGAIAATGLVHVTSMLTVDRIIQHKDMVVRSKKIRRELDGYKLAFVTDLHHLSDKKLMEMVDEINSHEPDLLVLGGDFSEKDTVLRAQLEALSRVKTSDGIYGVDGNHDDPAVLFPLMEEHGMTALPNTGKHLREGLYLGGVEDFRERNPDLDLALGGARADDFVIMLSHNPELVESHYTGGVDIMLCGHTHGGHTTLYGKYSPLLLMMSRTGHKYQKGWVPLKEGGMLYVCNGIGIHHGLPRVFARPQVAYLTLRSKA